MNKSINNFEIHSRGLRKNSHPTGFKLIFVNIKLSYANVTEDDMKKIITLSEDTYCPVWSMLKGNVEIEVRFIISNT